MEFTDVETHKEIGYHFNVEYTGRMRFTRTRPVYHHERLPSAFLAPVPPETKSLILHLWINDTLGI